MAIPDILNATDEQLAQYLIDRSDNKVIAGQLAPVMSAAAGKFIREKRDLLLAGKTTPEEFASFVAYEARVAATNTTTFKMAATFDSDAQQKLTAALGVNENGTPIPNSEAYQGLVNAVKTSPSLIASSTPVKDAASPAVDPVTTASITPVQPNSAAAPAPAPVSSGLQRSAAAAAAASAPAIAEGSNGGGDFWEMIKTGLRDAFEAGESLFGMLFNAIMKYGGALIGWASTGFKTNYSDWVAAYDDPSRSSQVASNDLNTSSPSPEPSDLAGARKAARNAVKDSSISGGVNTDGDQYPYGALPDLTAGLER